MVIKSISDTIGSATMANEPLHVLIRSTSCHNKSVYSKQPHTHCMAAAYSLVDLSNLAIYEYHPCMAIGPELLNIVLLNIGNDIRSGFRSNQQFTVLNQPNHRHSRRLLEE